MFIAKMDVVRVSTHRSTNSYKNVHAGNESVDVRMTHAMTKSDGGQQRNNQPANGGAAAAVVAAALRRRGGDGSAAAAHSATAAAWWQQRAAAAVRQRRTARRQQAMDGAMVRATASEGAGQEGGTMRGWREAMRQPAGREVPP
jgi:hypothetical protein